MKKFTSLLLLIACLCVRSYGASDLISLSARLDGAQETPPVTTNAIGVATFSLNATRDTLCMKMTVTGLSGPITSAHIHSGAVGVAGPVIFDLMPYFVGTSAAVSIAGTDLTPSLLSDYLSGNLYVNVHTAANPSGEIRGQIMPETEWQFTANLTGNAQVPPVTTNAMGLGTFTLSQHMHKMMIHVVVDSLSGPITGAHFHSGDSTTTGPVVLDLMPYVNGNTIVASINSDTILTDLLAGNIYINVHTTLNPAGEIRGQLRMDKNISFDAWMSGDQETPPVSSSAFGVANLKLNTTFDTLWYDILVTGLADTMTNAHFHVGAPGVSGGVAQNISTDIHGNRITGMMTGGPLSTNFISKLMKGDFYLNVHNSVNPNGEIRGQVYSVLREGISASIDGSQENTPVNTNAMGTLAGSIGRDTMDLHYMVVVDGLTPTAMHFHSAPIGQNGGVILDLMSMLQMNGAFGYWMSSDSVAFTPAIAMMVMNDSVYINAHTTANPAGEIRGQVEMGYACYSLTTGIGNGANELQLNAYPNPAADKLNIDFTESIPDATANITDVAGRVVMNIGLPYTNNAIDISSLAKGVYVVELNSTKGNSVFRIVKN